MKEVGRRFDKNKERREQQLLTATTLSLRDVCQFYFFQLMTSCDLSADR